LYVGLYYDALGNKAEAKKWMEKCVDQQITADKHTRSDLPGKKKKGDSMQKARHRRSIVWRASQ
jgi:hypothetical protein